MTHNARVAALAAAVAWVGVWVTLPPAALAQAPAGYQAPRTPWGDPDLQGTWPSTDMVGVPLERPVEFGTRATLSETEFQQRQTQAARQAEADDEEVVLPQAAGGGDGTGPPSHWLERGAAQRQNSLIVDPPDGRMPKMTPYGAERMAMRARYSSTGQGPFNSAADLDYYDRCISRGVVGSMLPVVYNNGTEIVQAPGYVAIRYEMIHDTRVIPLDGRPAPSSAIRGYMGEARGRWDGDTLVVETTNFNGTIGVTGNGRLRPASDAMRVTERFTRTGPDTIRYQATVNDPRTWTAPWTLSFPLKRDDAYGFYEYACHEGNNAMRNILSGARAAERGAGSR
ncbi:MAG TPA: hypothetical protein VFD69_14180 [Vicinamibacterales bacterium]|nr:hypothetical protein [Vicinamibacterales bacterium]